MNEPEDPPTTYECPACGQPVEPPTELMQNVVICPNCGHQFFIAVAPVDEEADDEAARADAEAEFARQRDLNTLRIRALSTERREIYRTRSYYILGAAGCAFGIYLIIRELVHGNFNLIGRASMIALAIGCAMGLPYFGKKIRGLHEDLARSKLPEPEQPPDFEPLEDGSQTWKQLEEMNRPKEEEEEEEQTPTDHQQPPSGENQPPFPPGEAG